MQRRELPNWRQNARQSITGFPTTKRSRRASAASSPSLKRRRAKRRRRLPTCSLARPRCAPSGGLPKRLWKPRGRRSSGRSRSGRSLRPSSKRWARARLEQAARERSAEACRSRARPLRPMPKQSLKLRSGNALPPPKRRDTAESGLGRGSGALSAAASRGSGAGTCSSAWRRIGDREPVRRCRVRTCAWRLRSARTPRRQSAAMVRGAGSEAMCRRAIRALPAGVEAADRSCPRPGAAASAPAPDRRRRRRHGAGARRGPAARHPRRRAAPLGRLRFDRIGRRCGGAADPREPARRPARSSFRRLESAVEQASAMRDQAAAGCRALAPRG